MRGSQARQLLITTTSTTTTINPRSRRDVTASILRRDEPRDLDTVSSPSPAGEPAALQWQGIGSSRMDGPGGAGLTNP